MEQAIAWQAAHCRENDASITAAIVAAQRALLHGDTAVARRLSSWPGPVAEQAVPLRLAGGLNWLHLSGKETRLAPVYAGEVRDQGAIDAIVGAVVADHDARLLTWLDGPPQTNEAGRSASIMAGLLWLARRVPGRFEMNEIGASAGANTMIERYAYDLGGVRIGPFDSPVSIAPEWRGGPPPAGAVDIVAIAGCDRAPIDLADPDAALRLRAYVWPENRQRLARLDAVITLARQKAPDLVRADAPDWVARRLAMPQQRGVTRVLYHSIVWQYLTQEARRSIEAAMAEAGTRASVERPLAWLMLETNRETFAHELRVRVWPGEGGWTLLGQAHAHGKWVEWLDRE